MFPVLEPFQVGEVRRKAIALAEGLAFRSTEAGKVAIVVTEAAANLVKHGGGGQILLQALCNGEVRGLEVLALDRGPGIANLQEAFRDGYSTGGSPGNGLGAMRRLSDLFEIHSVPGGGTALLANLWSARALGPTPHRPLEIGGLCVPHAGEEVCGDAWDAHQGPTRSRVLLADGLGHGPGAAEAVREAIRVFREHPAASPAALIELMHRALHGSRGAAAGVIEFEPARQAVRFAGVGNTTAVILSEARARHLVSHNGIVGHSLQRIEEFTYAWPPGALLIAHSDGLTSRWDLGRYPGLPLRHPSLIAGVLYRDFKRSRDDVTVVVARGTES